MWEDIIKPLLMGAGIYIVVLGLIGAAMMFPYTFGIGIVCVIMGFASWLLGRLILMGR